MQIMEKMTWSNGKIHHFYDYFVTFFHK